MSVMIAGVIAGAPGGAIGVATGYAIAASLLVYPAVQFCLKTSTLHGSDIWGAAWRPALAAVLSGALLVGLTSVLPSADQLAVRLANEAGLFVASSVAIWLATPGGLTNAREMMSMLQALRIQPRH